MRDNGESKFKVNCDDSEAQNREGRYRGYGCEDGDGNCEDEQEGQDKSVSWVEARHFRQEVGKDILVS